MCRVASHSVLNLYRLRKGLNLIAKVFPLVEQAFGGIHMESLWKILHHNGIPQKIINPIKTLYNDFHGRVIHDGDLTEPFSLNSGVKQGCLLSSLFCLISLDWATKETLDCQRLGIFVLYFQVLMLMYHLAVFKFMPPVCRLSLKMI